MIVPPLETPSTDHVAGRPAPTIPVPINREVLR